MHRIIIFLTVILFPALVYADDSVVARVNDAAITTRDLEAAVDRLIPRATYHGNVTEEKRNEFKEQALNNLIDQELQYQDALAKGMKPDKKQVKAWMERFRDRFKSKKEYRDYLERSGITDDDLRAKIEKAVLIEAVFKKIVTEPAQVSEAALKEYYDKNTAKFKQPVSIRLRIISAKDEKKVRDALVRIKAGEDFGDIAARMSEDNYRIKGGDIGYVHKGRIYPELEDTAFKLKAAETSGPIYAEGTWFVIKVEDIKPERQMSFEAVKDKLKKDLEKKNADELQEKWLSGLRAKAKIEVLLKIQ